ncbi:MAG: hypothetical protein JWN01_974 [Patescibacteria group bacterium]|nr:hypothetical protein [Patescibacteria group bacterium]
MRGDVVTVVCQTTGQRVQNDAGQGSTVWDGIQSDHITRLLGAARPVLVPDVWVGNTGNHRLKQCV